VNSFTHGEKAILIQTRRRLTERQKGVLAIRSGLEGRANMAGNLLDREPNIRGQETLAMQANFTLPTPVGNIESNATS